jgi:hypothetical protein
MKQTGVLVRPVGLKPVFFPVQSPANWRTTLPLFHPAIAEQVKLPGTVVEWGEADVLADSWECVEVLKGAELPHPGPAEGA